MQVPSVDHHVLHRAPEGDRGNLPGAHPAKIDVARAKLGTTSRNDPDSLGALLISTQKEAE